MRPHTQATPTATKQLVSLFLCLSAAILLSACSFHASSSASAKSSGSASSKSSSSAHSSGSAKAGSSGSAHASGNASASGKSKGGAAGSASGKNKSRFKMKFSFKTKARAGGVKKRSKKHDKFKATFLVGGGASAKADASAKASATGSASASSKSKKKNNTKTHKKNDTKKSKSSKKDDSKKSKKSKSSKKDDSKKSKKNDTKTPKKNDTKTPKKNDTKTPKKNDTKTPKKNDTKTPKPVVPVVTPAPTPVVEVIEPPETPPENVFGYEQPVTGCFEGIVYPIKPHSWALPRAWHDLTPVSVVYACEWDIPPTKWSTGFPGVDDRDEWFAIQYTGGFYVETAGTWKFRISSDDGSKLYIDGKLVLNNDGQHEPKEKEGSVTLTAGNHEMVLEYFQGPRFLINLQLFATPPGGEEGIFSVR